MIKYAKIINNDTKQCDVGIGTNIKFYKKLGMIEMDVVQAYNGGWYVNGYAPVAPEKNYAEKRRDEYPSVPEQLDMIYWDSVNGTTKWQQTIDAIKSKYPKE